MGLNLTPLARLEVDLGELGLYHLGSDVEHDRPGAAPLVVEDREVPVSFAVLQLGLHLPP